MNKILLDKWTTIDTYIGDSILYADSIDYGESLYYQFPFIDSTKCFINKGYLMTKPNDMFSSELVITERTYNDTIVYVDHWDRKEWKFLFWKTKLFGKKYVKVDIMSECGKNKSFVVDQE